MSTGTWQLKLFGGFKLYAPSGQAYASRAKRDRLLIAYLALCPRAESNRRALAEALFEEDELEPYSNFALLLTRLGKALTALDPLPLMKSRDGEVALDLDAVDIDLHRFNALTRDGAIEPNLSRRAALLARALSIADGPLMQEIRVPLLLPLIEQAEERVLSAVTELSGLPLASQYQSVILERLRTFEETALFDPLRMEHVLRVYGNLGIKEKVIQTFTAYEAWLQDEFGEQPRETILRLFDRFSRDTPDRNQRARRSVERPAFTVGRNEEIEACLKIAVGSGGIRIATLTGLSGIGKSHVLRELFWRIPDDMKPAYLDLSVTPLESITRWVEEEAPKVLILDEAAREHAGFIDRVLSENEGLRIVAASHQRLGLAAESLVLLSPLDFDTPSSPGVELVTRHLGNGEGPGKETAANRAKQELACLCDGIPLAIEIASKLASSIGVETTIASLRRDAASLNRTTYDGDHHHSLGRAIERSYMNLTPGAAKLARALSSFGHRMPRDLLVYASGAGLEELEELVLSGLANLEDNQYVRIPQTASRVVKSLNESAQESFLVEFAKRTGDWFAAQASAESVDLRIAPALSVGIEALKRLQAVGRTAEAVELFLSMRPWFGSFQVTTEDLETISEIATTSEAQKAESWGDAVITLAIVYFHARDIPRMMDLLHRARSSEAFESLTPKVRSRLIMQAGIAEREQKHWEEAEALYAKALEIATEFSISDQIVLASYNMAVMFENRGRLIESRNAFDTAAANFGPGTDARLQSLVRCGVGRIMYRLGQVSDAKFVLVSAVYDAMERDEKRGAAEILQNLGLVYYAQGEFRKAALVETLGTSILLEFGYNDYFRRLSKSSFVTLSASLHEIGLRPLSLSARIMIDRLGDTELYRPNQDIYEKVVASTYRSPDVAGRDLAGEHEVRALLERCLRELRSDHASEDETQELSAFLSVFGA